MQARGYAILIVLLFSSIILISMLSSSFFSGIGARRGTTNEQTAYQALLAAESGLDAFPARLKAVVNKPVFNYIAGTVTWNDLASTYTLVNGITISLNAVPTTYSGRKIVRLTSTASLGGVAKKVVMRDFLAPDSSFAYGGASAAMMSFSSATYGSASYVVNGTDPSSEVLSNTIKISTPPSVSFSGTQITFNVNANPTYVTGDKIRIAINGIPYTFDYFSKTSAVTTSPKKDATLTISNTTGVTFAASDFPKNTEVSKVTLSPPYTLQAAVPIASGAPSSILTLNTVVGLRVESGSLAQSISVTQSGTTLTGTITVINAQSNQVTVSWNPVPSSSLTLSTSSSAINPVVPAVLSMSTVSPRNSVLSPTYVQNSSLFSDAQTMFEAFFGTTKNQLQANSSYVKSITPATLSANPDLDAVYYQKPSSTVNYDIVYTQGDTYISGGGPNKLCGTKRVLIIDGDLTITGSGSPTLCFQGLIYITGNLVNAGNVIMKGAIVVEKQIIGSGTPTISFNPDVFPMASLNSVAGASNPDVYTPLSNWRQQ